MKFQNFLGLTAAVLLALTACHKVNNVSSGHRYHIKCAAKSTGAVLFEDSVNWVSITGNYIELTKDHNNTVIYAFTEPQICHVKRLQ